MKTKLLFILFLALGVGNIFAQTELINNGNFSNGSTNWTISGNWYINSSSSCSNTTPGYAYAGDASGNAVINETGDLKQTITIPSTATSATFTFGASKSTDETTTTIVYDYVNVFLLDASGAQLMQFTPTNIDNLYSGKPVTLCDGYSPKSFSIPTQYFGQSIQIVFSVHSDGGPKNTMFRIDDVSLTYLAPACTAVSIASQPQNQTVTAGNTATFNVTTGGTSPYSYFWFKNGVQISGASSSSYTTPTLATGDNGNYYYCIITNCTNTYQATSNNANLTVNSSCVAVSISGQPSNQSATVGNTATFSVNTGGTSPYTYQWYKNGSQISGATNNSYITASLTLSDNGNTYYCYVTNCLGNNNATSNNATLTVNTSSTYGSVNVTINPSGAVSAGATWNLDGAGTYASGYTLQNVSVGSHSVGFNNNATGWSSPSSQSINVSNGITTSATGIYITTVVTPLPSQVTINNVIANNSTFPTSKKLWSGYTNQTALVIKICADGSTATKITFTNNTGIDSKNIKFWIASDPYGNNSELTGYFINYKVNGNTITADFAHPKYLEATYRPFRSDNIQIVDNTKSSPSIFTIPIQIYRAPVLMVHGLWGKRSDFDKMEYDLFDANLYPPNNSFSSLSLSPLLFKVDYEKDNAKKFSTNAGVVPKEINNLLSSVINTGYSAGKVDIVAHSMGGILARIYLQSNSYKLDIHKLITFDTPHFGTQAANFLLSWCGLETNLLVSVIHNTREGAVEDLKVDSYAITATLNGVGNINNNITPSHAISAQNNCFNNFFTWDRAIIFFADETNNTLLCPRGGLGCNSFMSDLYNSEPSDLIVPISSQQGGLNAITNIMNEVHTGVTNNKLIIDTTQFLLNQNPNSNFFNSQGFKYTSMSSSFKKAQTKESLLIPEINGDVKITSPQNGASYSNGDTINISVTGNVKITKLICGIGGANADIFIEDTLMSSTIFKYHVPQNAFGEIKIIVIGNDISGFVNYDTVIVNVNISSIVDSIKYYPDTIRVSVNNSSSVTLKGYFNDGYVRNLESLNEVQYHILDTNIAMHTTLNLIDGKRIGTTLLVAFYQNKKIEIPIVVIPEDTTTHVVTSSKDIKQVEKILDIKIYPNPFNLTTHIEYNLKENGFVSLKIYNLFGAEISTLVNANQEKGTHHVVFNRGILSNGIYFYNLTFYSVEKEQNVIIKSGKIIIAD